MHVYPHSTLPLMPKILISALNEEKYALKSGETVDPANLCKSDFCQKLSQENKAFLAQQVSTAVQKICYGRTRKAPWSLNSLNVDQSVNLSDLDLTDRALVSLQKHDYFSSKGNWRKASIGEMIGPKENHRIGARLLLAVLLAIESIEDLKNNPQAIKINTVFESVIQKFIRGQIHSSRVAEIYTKANGWDCEPKKTLNEIAGELGITHERARQLNVIAQQAIDKSSDDYELTNKLAILVKQLSNNSPMQSDAAQSMLSANGYINENTSMESVKNGLIACKFNGKFDIEIIDGQEFIVFGVQAAIIRKSRQIIRKALRSTGIIEVKPMEDQIYKTLTSMNFNIHDVQNMRHHIKNSISSMPGWSYLDYERKWATVTLGTDGQELYPRGPAAKIAKMAWYFNGVNLSLAKSVLDLQDQHWPSKILTSLCLRMGLTVKPTENDWLISTSDFMSKKVKHMLDGTAEIQMVEILQKKGGYSTRNAFIEECEKQGVHRSTIFACLKTASLFVCLDKETIVLSTNPEVINSAQKSMVKKLEMLSQNEQNPE